MRGRRLEVAAAAVGLTASLCGEGRASRVVDFDDTLEDLSLDWTNPTLLS